MFGRMSIYSYLFFYYAMDGLSNYTLSGRKSMDSIVRAVIAKFEERSRLGLAK